jgi:hypothetical protein
MAEVRTDRRYGNSSEHDHSYMPQRLAEDVIPYKGPDKMTRERRVRREIIGVGIFLVVGILAILIAWLQGPLR